MPKVPTVTPQGPVIQDLRERAGLSRAQLGKKVGRHHQSIRRLEMTTQPASRLIVSQVANILGVPLERLIVTESENSKAA